MRTTFLGQGYEDQSLNAVGNYLMNYLELSCFDSFTGISAFASESGVYGLSHFLNVAKRTFTHLNLIVGVDLEGTSKEALEEILALNINSYIFYQKEQPIFHPKIYLFEGPSDIKIIIGSSNLTRGGLFTNVESSILIEFNSDDSEGLAFLVGLKNYYRTLFDFSDPNLFRISENIIAGFYNDGIIPNETTRRNNFHKKAIASVVAPSTISNALSVQNRITSRVPSAFPSKPRNSGPRTGVAPATSTTVATHTPTPTSPPLIVPPAVILPSARTLVWSKLALSQSDAQAVPAGTNGTGNLKLSQARFMHNGAFIDYNTYFRYQVFQHLAWARTKTTSATYEETICDFDVTILGTSYGSQLLKLSHDSARISGQANVSSWLHWGNVLMTILQQTNVTGRTLNLYQLSNSTFSIEII